MGLGLFEEEGLEVSKWCWDGTARGGWVRRGEEAESERVIDGTGNSTESIHGGNVLTVPPCPLLPVLPPPSLLLLISASLFKLCFVLELSLLSLFSLLLSLLPGAGDVACDAAAEPAERALTSDCSDTSEVIWCGSRFGDGARLRFIGG